MRPTYVLTTLLTFTPFLAQALQPYSDDDLDLYARDAEASDDDLDFHLAARSLLAESQIKIRDAFENYLEARGSGPSPELAKMLRLKKYYEKKKVEAYRNKNTRVLEDLRQNIENVDRDIKKLDG